MRTVSAAAALLLGCLALESYAQPLPPDFSIVAVNTNNLTHPISIAFLPGYRPPNEQHVQMIIAELGGRVLYQEYAGSTATELMTLTGIGAGTGELGLIGVQVDPRYDTLDRDAPFNYVYLSYTEEAPPGTDCPRVPPCDGCDCEGTCQECMRTRIDRFRFKTNPVEVFEREVVWTGVWHPICASPCGHSNHWAGDIHFLGSDTLFLTIGDHVAPELAQSPAAEHGKLLRFDRDAQGSWGAPVIWALGLRNPFRFNVDEVNGTIYIGNVGSNGECPESGHSEELNVTDAVTPGVNFGWPCTEGPPPNCVCEQYECAGVECDDFTPPYWTYPRVTGDGNAIMGGPVYHGSRYPSEYQDHAFVADFNRGWIKRVPINDPSPQAMDFANLGVFGAIDLEIGPDESLYFVQLLANHERPAGVYRVGYREPTAAIQVEQQTVPGDPDDLRNVQFYGQLDLHGVSFPDATFSYSWSFGDSEGSTEQNPFHVYAERREYVVEFTATIHSPGLPDWIVPAGAVEIATGLRPNVVITAPGPNLEYRVPCPVLYSATGAVSYDWRVEFYHIDHPHLISGLDGSGVFVPTSDGSANGHEDPLPIQFVVEGEDSRGISNKAVSPLVQPAAPSPSLTISTRPDQLVTVEYDDTQLTVVTPWVVSGLPAGATITVTVPKDGFQCWLDDPAAEYVRDVVLQSGDQVITADYGCCMRADVTADGVVDLADLTAFLSAFGGRCCSIAGPVGLYQPDCDFDSDCEVSFADMTYLLSHFGDTCP